MDPSAETISEWNAAAGAVNLIFDWAGLDADVAAVVMGALDLDAGGHYRALAMFSYDEIPFDNLNLTLGQKKKTHLALRGARVAAGVKLTTAEEKQKALQPPSAPTTAPPSSAASLAGSSLEAPDTIKLSQVLCQGQPGEVKLMSEADYQAARDRYKKVVGDPPGQVRSPPVSS